MKKNCDCQSLYRQACTIGMLLLLAACAGSGPQPYLPDRSSLQAGETITVKGNENIYVVAHEHNVSMRDLIVLNDLRPPFEIKPGQSLVLPAGGASFSGDIKPPAAAPLVPVDKNVLGPITPPAVSSQDLEPVTPPPSSSPPPAANTAPQTLVTQPAPMGGKDVKQAATIAEPVPALNRPSPPQQPTATTTAEIAAAETTGTTSSIPMVWPVQGPIVSSFGAKGPGLNNDGINISAPKGAPVVAAAPGTVVYAGNEMKGFGNLVLIRHQGDWVTAYAHLDRVMVKKDSVVATGDMIGTVGKTGDVPSPQLHFETRHAGKPVDPAQVIKNAT